MPTFTFPCTADAYVVEISPDETKGTTDPMYLNVGRNYIFAPKIEFWSYVRFDIFSQIPASAVISSATLNLYVENAGGDPSIQLFVLTGTSTTWEEATITWNNRPTATGVAIVEYGGLSAKGQFNFSCTTLVQEMVTNNYVNGFKCTGGVTVGDDHADLRSKEFNIPADTPPTLAVTWTVPVGMMFLGINNHLGLFEGGVDGNAMLLGFNPPTRM